MMEWEFWNAYLDRYPEDRELGFDRVGTSHCILPLASGLPIQVRPGIRTDEVNVFVRGPNGAKVPETTAILAPSAAALERCLGLPFEPGAVRKFKTELPIDNSDPHNWPLGQKWLHEMARHYLAILEATLVGRSR